MITPEMMSEALRRCGSPVRARGPIDARSPPTAPGDGATWPNVVSILGYFAAIAYLQGASPWFAVASIAADELDGRLARATGQTSNLGADLDWGIDVTLTGLFADRLGILWLLPPITGAQAYLRSQGHKPTILSGRALMMLVALWRSKFGRLPTHPSALETIERARAPRALGPARAVGVRSTPQMPRVRMSAAR